MVQGLGFLSKKSWHTKNIANQERVWVAEEREKVEKQKTAELAKQIQQEREDDELRRATGTDKTLDRGIAWLYDGHKKESETAKEDAAKQAEEYLLGKPIAAAAGKATGDFDTAQAHEGVNALVPAVAKDDANSSRQHQDKDTTDSVAYRNEAFRIRHEDPMYAVSLQSVRQEKAVEHRKDLYERAGIAVETIRHDDGERGRDGAQTERKRKKKDNKKRKKDEKKLRKRYNDDSDSEDDDENSRRYSRRHKKRRHRSRSRSRSVESDRSRHRTKQSHRSRSLDESPYEAHRAHGRRRRSRSVSRSGRRRSDSRSRSTSPKYKREMDRDEFGRSLKSDKNHAQPRSIGPTRVEGYGLQGTAMSNDNRPTAANLGPDPELLRAKRKSREAERYQRIERTSSRQYKSAAEREQARREMERDAARRAKTHDTRMRQADDDMDDRPGRDAPFLRDATVKAHGLNGNEKKLSDRLRENRHRNQSLSDSFL